MPADLCPVRLLLVTLAGWINRHQQAVIEYLVEENRVLRPGQVSLIIAPRTASACNRPCSRSPRAAPQRGAATSAAWHGTPRGVYVVPSRSIA
jgi:hypothetical protein